MNANQNAQSVETAKAVVMGNTKEVANKQETAVENASLILLPTLPEQPKEKKTKTEAKVKAEKAESQQAAPKSKKMSIDELTDKAERVYMLQNKYSEIRSKRKQLQAFVLKHEEETAQLTLVDARGMSIVTHNPTAIKNLLADWGKDLNSKLKEVENNLRTELEHLL
ncbi:hypothetical protein [Bacteroides sp.]|jgi:hypothetical protein|uniref:hypothetical protein n=1 Tax=Bacteroides sp. TaxID=29523 RepID=UPI0025905002|nr:hypothetical protein [Bacteroides sp.]